jgi:glycosyltransferase involved in cell wall biosynthesis
MNENRFEQHENLLKPSIAAVITTHRRARCLGNAIASVQAQTMPVQEILICEDGYDQATNDVVEAASRFDSRIRHLHVRAPARGAGANRNLGIDATSSAWIAFLDDDDRWLPQKTALQAQLLPNADLICGNAIRSSGHNYFSAGRGEKLSRRNVMMSNPVITSSCLVRRAALEAVGGFSPDLALLGAEDYECWLRLSDFGARFAYLDNPVIKYADEGHDRLSARTVALSGVVAGIAWRRAIRERSDTTCWLAAGRHALPMATTRVRSALDRSI